MKVGKAATSKAAESKILGRYKFIWVETNGLNAERSESVSTNWTRADLRPTGIYSGASRSEAGPIQKHRSDVAEK